MSVSSITASSISLSWSVASGSVASWEVVWRERDRGTESSSGSLTGTSYTIDQLESTTIYTVTVRASNVAGTTDSQPITFSTGECVATPASSIIATFSPHSTVASETESVASTCAESDNTAGVVITIVAVAFITALTGGSCVEKSQTTNNKVKSSKLCVSVCKYCCCREGADVPAATNQAIELTQATYV